ncbi:MAG: YceI family protein [Mycobacterium sp.]
MPGLTELLADEAFTGLWNVVPERSEIAVKSRSFWGLLPVTVRFPEVSGNGQLTPAGELLGRLDLTTASLSSGIGKRDEHLRSADYFDVERYPDISVVVTAATPGSGDTAELRAQITIAGTTRPVTLPATMTVLDDGAVRVSVRATIQRGEFGVDGNMLGMVGQATKLVGDAVFLRAT